MGGEMEAEEALFPLSLSSEQVLRMAMSMSVIISLTKGGTR